MGYSDNNSESEFPFPKDKVFDAMYQAIWTIKGMKIENADKVLGRITVKAKTLLLTSGENITIQLFVLTNDRTRVQISSLTPIFGTNTINPQHRKNIETILAATSRIISPQNSSSNFQQQTNPFTFNPVKKSSSWNQISPVLKWIYGFCLLVGGLMMMFSTSFIGGLFFILAGLILLPPTLKIIEAKLRLTLPRTIKIIAVIGFSIVGIIFMVNKQDDEEKEKKKQEQITFDKLPKHIKDSLNLVKAQQDSLDKIQRAEQEIASDAASRKEKVEKQFSQWDGSHRGLTQYIKDHMNDPDSYEHVETRFADKGSFILVVTKFRGKNAFGGKVLNEVTAKVDFDGNVLEIISQTN